jgi:hypothetical protein
VERAGPARPGGCNSSGMTGQGPGGVLRRRASRAPARLRRRRASASAAG